MLRMSMRWILGLALISSAACQTVDGGGTSDTEPQGTSDTEPQGTSDTEPQGEPMYCPGQPEWGYPICRIEDDCQEPALCVPAPDDCPGPGCESNCEVDADCVDLGGAGVCTFPFAGCCASAGICALACDQTGCAADETCEPDGHCTPIPCDGGYACAEGFACDPGTAGADRHGCALIPCDQNGALPCGVVFECVTGACQRIACSTDGDCPCGTCIQQQCWERPWVCDEGNA
jgi:hypothetical protein